jgi:hypothetical protein
VTAAAGPMGYTRLRAVAVGGRRPVLTKVQTATGQRSYDNAMWFAHHAEVWPKDIDGLAKRLQWLAARPHDCIVRAALTEDAKPDTRQRCLLHAAPPDPATVHEVPRAWVFTDIDSLPEPPLWDWRKNPHEAAADVLIHALPPFLAEADMVVMFSPSHGFKPGMRLRAAHLLDRPLVRTDLDALLAGYGLDLSLNRPRQFHYTAAPILDGVADPLGGIGNRIFVLRRSRRVAVVPPRPLVAQPPHRPGPQGAGGGVLPISPQTKVRPSATPEEMLAGMRRAATHGGPGLHKTGIDIVSLFRRQHGTAADASDLIECVVERAREVSLADGVTQAEVDGYCAKMRRALVRFAEDCARRQRAARAGDLAAFELADLTEADLKPAALRERMNLSFLDNPTSKA